MNSETLLQEALEALQFYANELNWHRPINPYSKASLHSSAMLDGGNIAKRAIEEIKIGLSEIVE